MTEREKQDAAQQSIKTANRRATLAALVMKCDPAMITALEGTIGIRGPGE